MGEKEEKRESVRVTDGSAYQILYCKVGEGWKALDLGNVKPQVADRAFEMHKEMLSKGGVPFDIRLVELVTLRLEVGNVTIN